MCATSVTNTHRKRVVSCHWVLRDYISQFLRITHNERRKSPRARTSATAMAAHATVSEQTRDKKKTHKHGYPETPTEETRPRTPKRRGDTGKSGEGVTTKGGRVAGGRWEIPRSCAITDPCDILEMENPPGELNLWNPLLVLVHHHDKVPRFMTAVSGHNQALFSVTCMFAVFIAQVPLISVNVSMF